MRPLAIRVFAGMVTCATALSSPAEAWHSFTSRSGWTMEYPHSWKTATCHSCSDPKASGVFVDFFPPSKQEATGWVMISPLAKKPASLATTSWLNEIASEANTNLHVGEQLRTVNDKPALQVRYVTADGSFMEEVYIVAGLNTFSISFTGGVKGRPVDQYANYAAFKRMVGSFVVTRD